jgi:hypothetical protein
MEMKERTLIALGVVLGMGLALSVMAAGKPLVVKGTITAIDAKARTVAVSTQKEVLDLKVNSNAEMVEGGKPILWGELRVGDQVEVDYLTTGGVHTASRLVRVHAAPAKAKQSAEHHSAHPTNK